VVSGGAAAGVGVAPKWIHRVLGVAKAYTTRVGAGPMPTELLDATGEAIRTAGAEFGTVTGRPRRCGWFDAAIVRFTTQVNGFTELALTKWTCSTTCHAQDLRGLPLKDGPAGVQQYWRATRTGWKTSSRSTWSCPAGRPRPNR
jgi:adenylosuccinate synthase